ncbi:hypothetical protein N5C72_07800 [Achromobacter mucicolens]|uniref:Uncharacterized protein n=1 Tax=Achromobacter mucicolens TaxID=1389922 RepID=A0ABD4YUC2_9BURK|nr:hypothetical protein [Achromobacter mucicolens]MDH1177974.1 hypothetical protein [Achromobacter mucicolens]
MNQNNAAQPMLTDEEIRAVWVEHCLDDESVEDFARAIESALLSKLRAPVAEPFDAEVLAERLRDVAASHYETALGFGISRDNFERCATDAAKIARDMASAPVADTWTTGDDDLDMALNMAGVPGDGALAQMEAVERLKARLASAPVAGERANLRRVIKWGADNIKLEGPEAKQFASFLVELERAALASAPVAGEAHPVGRVRHFNYSGIARNGFSQEAVLNDDAPSLPDWTLLYAAPQASEAECSCPSGNGSLRHPCAVHGGDHFRDATKMVGASEAAGIEEAFAGIDGLVELRNASLEEAATAVEARIGVGEPGIDTLELDRETQECANAIRALKSQSAALSAQPGAQKNCNCATCRPHSVEMRMILCEVCGDKRCPHAADHRNECSNQPKQHNDGGADAI